MKVTHLLPLAALGIVLSSCDSRQVSPPALGTETDRARVLQACEDAFGPPVDQEHGLFEVDRDFVLEVRFDESGSLDQLGILPKHWFADQHPEWDEAEDVGELTETQYESLLRRLDSIQPRGPLVTPDELPVVAGTTARRRDVYERAVVVTGDVADTDRPDDAPRAIKYFLVSPTAETGVSLGAEADEGLLLPCSYVSLIPGDGDSTEHAGCARYTESGELVVLAEHLEAATAGEELVTIRVAERWYYLRPDGTSLEVILYDNGPDYFSEGLVRGLRDGWIGYWNERLEPVIAPRYDWGWPFEGGLALVCSGCRQERLPGEEHTSRVGGLWGVIDAQGNEVIALHEDREAVTAALEERLAGGDERGESFG